MHRMEVFYLGDMKKHLHAKKRSIFFLTVLIFPIIGILFSYVMLLQLQILKALTVFKVMKQGWIKEEVLIRRYWYHKHRFRGLTSQLENKKSSD